MKQNFKISFIRADSFETIIQNPPHLLQRTESMLFLGCKEDIAICPLHLQHVGAWKVFPGSVQKRCDAYEIKEENETNVRSKSDECNTCNGAAGTKEADDSFLRDVVTAICNYRELIIQEGDAYEHNSKSLLHR